MKEIDLQNQIRIALSQYGIVIRQNTGKFYTKDGRCVVCGIKGLPDLLFLGENGETAMIEVKTASGRISDAQKRFLERMKAMGHRAGIARSVTDALKIAGVADAEI